MKFPRIQTIRGAHTLVRVTFEEGADPLEGCGDTWCVGDCGLPALIIRHPPGPALKAHSDSVATGHVMQRFRVKWTGTTIEIPEQFREHLLDAVWF
jgi:hypothetical protein